MRKWHDLNVHRLTRMPPLEYIILLTSSFLTFTKVCDVDCDSLLLLFPGPLRDNRPMASTRSLRSPAYKRFPDLTSVSLESWLAIKDVLAFGYFNCVRKRGEKEARSFAMTRNLVPLTLTSPAWHAFEGKGELVRRKLVARQIEGRAWKRGGKSSSRALHL